MATQKQLNFIDKLAGERELDDAAQAYIAARLHEGTALSGQLASRLIDRLLAAPRKKGAIAQQEGDLPKVPEGHYALETPDGTQFFAVEIGKRGRWAGVFFVSRLAGENHEPIKNVQIKTAILRDIAADVEAAARRYGHYRKSCSFCRHDLSDQFSRFYGIGPKCARDRDLPFSFASFLKRRPDQAGTVERWLEHDGKVRGDKVSEVNPLHGADVALF